MRFSRLANLIAAIVVVLALASAETALAAARDPEVTAPSPEPIARSAVHSATNVPEADAAGGVPGPAPRVSPDPASPLLETGVPSKAQTPPESPATPLFAKTGEINAGATGADAVLDTSRRPQPCRKVQNLQVNAVASAVRNAAVDGRNGARPPAQAAPVTSHGITLSPGANLISLPLVPDEIGIEAVLAGILDRVETVWQYDTSGAVPKWRSYAPGAPSELGVMRDGPGYWVHLKDGGAGDAALTITGRDASGPARPVARGWNLVGFTSTVPQAPGEYLGALGGSAGTTMVGYAGWAVEPVLPSATTPQLMPGRGYWLYLDAAGTIGGAPPAATDRAALVALYNATDGGNWAINRNWLSNAPMGEWHGVTTDSDGQVTHLDLNRNQLTGEIPAELGSLTNLTQLFLSRNQLTGEIPAELGSLTNLTQLFLSRNQLTGEIPVELGSLTNLTQLSLWGNQLTGEIPAELGSLTNLERLSLCCNQLTGEIPAELGSLTNLTQLSLWDNQLTGEIPAELGNLTNLEYLYFRSNQLTGEIPAELGSLTNLERLWLEGNGLTGEIPAELGNLTNLEYLSLCCNQLTGEIPVELGSLTNLTHLTLGSNRLIGCIPEGLRNIPTNDLAQLGLPFCDMPGAPTIATPIVPGDASLTVAWAAPINTGSSAITAYDLRYIETGAADKSDANWTVVEDVWAAGSGSLQYTLTGLTGGTQYDVQVRAVNAAGASAWSATVTGTTTSAVVPGAPTGLTAAVTAGKAQVVLSWTAPTDTGGAPITGYKIEASDDGNNPWTEVYTTTGDATGYTDEGADSNGPMFEVGTTRHYRVSAINSVGTGPPSNVAVTEDLVARYDGNGNGTIEKNEVIAAINDYLFGEGDKAISKGDVIRLINLYLFG